MEISLDGKVALVTGVGPNIGSGVALALSRYGAKVACNDVDEAAIKACIARVERNGGEAMAAPGDVTDEAAVQNYIADVLARWGHIDILVNNAATNVAFGPCLEIDEGQFDKMVEVNLKSTFRLVRLVAPGMCERGSGSIINISSVSGIRPQFHSLLYSMTKAALIMMTQSYALELGPKGVRVNAIAPGVIETQLSEIYWKGDRKNADLIGHQAIRRVGQPADIAEVALLMASDRGSFMTGHTAVVDGGFLLPAL